MTVTRRIRRRGEHEISRKTIACGNAWCSGGPVVTKLVCLTTLCARGCGCSGHPAFPTPSVGRKIHAQLGRIAPRGREVVSEIRAVIACDKREAFAQGSTCDEAIHTFFARQDGLLRFARNDGSTPDCLWLFEIRKPSL